MKLREKFYVCSWFGGIILMTVGCIFGVFQIFQTISLAFLIGGIIVALPSTVLCILEVYGIIGFFRNFVNSLKERN